jgi:hypothetical protein
MIKIIIIIVSLFIFSFSFGQTEIQKSNISSDGGTASSGSIKIIYTVGELAVQENTQGTINISEGFISSGMLISSGIEEYTKLQNVKLYPNPATNFVNVDFFDTCNYQIKLMNIQGKEIFEISGSGDFKKIPLNNLSEGEYIMLVKNLKDKQYKVFSIIKKR